MIQPPQTDQLKAKMIKSICVFLAICCMNDFKSLMDCLEAKKVRSEVRSVGRREIPGSGGTERQRDFNLDFNLDIVRNIVWRRVGEIYSRAETSNKGEV